MNKPDMKKRKQGMELTSDACKGEQKEVHLWQVYVEYLRHPDNWLFISLAVSALGWLTVSGIDVTVVAWIAFGWLFFLPQEYFTHVFVLHRRLPQTERVYRYLYRLHYGHHDYPKRHDLMYMPLWLTVPTTLLNIVVLWLITPSDQALVAAFLGTVSGYLLFEWVHLFCHVPYTPKTAYWRRVRKRHLLHHFYSEKNWFAVAPFTVFWDRLMGTDPDRRALERSSSARYLGLQSGHAWIQAARNAFAHRSSGTIGSSRLWLRTSGGQDSDPINEHTNTTDI